MLGIVPQSQKVTTMYTESARTYVQVEQKKADLKLPSWDDVAADYDAGLLHGVEARQHARVQLEAVRKAREVA